MSRFVMRLLLIPTGYLLAVLAATLVLIGVTIAHGTPADPVEQGVFTVMLFAFAPTLWWIAGPIATAGFAVIVALAEVFAIRSWVFHALGGSGVALMTWSLMEIGESGPVFSAVEAGAAGLAAGLVYWLVAGRTSGTPTSASTAA